MQHVPISQRISYLKHFSGNLEVTVEFLTEIDKLVQLIESPIFACKESPQFFQGPQNLLIISIKFPRLSAALRLTLISQEKKCPDAHYLAQALFGILMLLPQTDAFLLLKNRLQCVPMYWGHNTEVDTSLSVENQSSIDFNALLEHFQKIQEFHHQQRMIQRRKSILLWE